MALSMGKVLGILFLVLLFLGLLATALTYWIKYDECNKEVESLKKFQKVHFSTPEPEHDSGEKNAKNADSERITSEIEGKEYYCVIYYAVYVLSLMMAILIPILVCLSHALLQFDRHFPDIDPQECPFLRFFTQLSCPCSEDSFVDNSEDWRVTYDPSVSEAVVSRRTRNVEGGVVQEPSADLPGVPLASND